MTSNASCFSRTRAGVFALAVPLFIMAGCASSGSHGSGSSTPRAALADCAHATEPNRIDGPPGDSNALDGPSPAAPIPVLSAIEPSPARRPQCTEPRANVVAKRR